MPNLFTKKIFIVIIFFLLIFLLPEFIFAAATSPDAIATRVFPNSDHLSPLRWYQTNIKNQGSPQALTVDGYEAVRDGRTVYVNAANIDLNNKYCSNNQTKNCTDANVNSNCGAGNTCLPKFYTNIYLLSFNQTTEQATEDIFGQLLAHWKFNINIPPENKDNVRNDTKRLADLAEIKLALNNYQKNHNGDFPSLAAGSYVVGKSVSVWPSWQATLAKELGVTLPVDPVNKIGICSNDANESKNYDLVTCWDQKNKKFAGLSNNSRVYIYVYNGKESYNICGFMQSSYLTTLAQGACTSSAIGYTVACNDSRWTSKFDPATVCTTDKVPETSNCNNTRNILPGTKCCDSTWTPNVDPATVCTTQTITETGDCGATRNTLYGFKVCTQTVNCSAKPANTDWNTSSTVLQTWDGTAWQPSNSSSYDITAGTCKYKCQSGYELSGSICVLSCVANCSGKNCGDNGCGGSCGTCSSTQFCSGAGVCVDNCTPNCTSTHNCGDDGCGGSCGSCNSGNLCTQGNCCTVNAGIQVCSDNCHDTYFNGNAVSNACDWGSVQEFSVTVRPGKNVIAVKASDWGSLYGFSATLNRTGCFSMTTDDLANWKCVNSDPGASWININFDDSSWSGAVLGNPGTIGPRGGNSLPYGQIWAYGAGEGATVWCRYSFNAN